MAEDDQAWTFETTALHDHTKWQKSGQRLKTIAEAATEAAKWMEACAENGVLVCTRLVDLSAEPADLA